LRQLKKNLEKKKLESNITLEEIQFKQEEINEIDKTPDHPLRTEKMFIKDIQDKFYRKVMKSTIIGDTIGNALKDLSGPSLIVVIKLVPLLCIISVKFFANTSYLLQN